MLTSVESPLIVKKTNFILGAQAGSNYLPEVTVFLLKQ